MDKNYTIEYLPVAQNDLIGIVNRFSAVNSDKALAFIEQLEAALTPPDYLPLPGSVPKNELLYQLGYRIFLVGKYLLFCIVRPGSIEVRRILPYKREYRFLL